MLYSKRGEYNIKTDEIFIRRYGNGCVPVRPVEITKVFTLFLRCCREPFAFAGELHEQWEMVYIRKGEARITADDKVYDLSEGSLMFHRPMEFHQIYAQQTGLEIFVVSFHMVGEKANRFEHSVFELLPEEKELLEELIGRSVALNGGCFRDGEFEDCTVLWEQNSLEFYACVNLLESIFCRLLLRSPALQMPKETTDSLLYRNIVAVLEEHIYTDITIWQVAEQCRVSPSSVKACFSRHAGCGMHKYFLKIKIRAAIGMIREGRAISEVSDALGFNNPNYFTYVFRRETGKRPTDFRT